MSKVYNNGIITTSGFKYNADSPLDDRLIVETYDDLSSLNKYDGMVVYVKNENLYYKYTNNNWDIFSNIIQVYKDGYAELTNQGDSDNSIIIKSTLDSRIKDVIDQFASGGLTREVVEALPSISNANESTIYMVKNNNSTEQNIYDEFMLINSSWEVIGSTAVDLSGYAKTSEVEDAITNAIENSKENPIQIITWESDD